MTKDVIRLGKFQDSKCEELRKRIVECDCGFVSKIINETNKELQNVIQVEIAREILANCLQEIQAEIPHEI